jgi:glycosyltransferase involved in cell wall biosynthesis
MRSDMIRRILPKSPITTFGTPEFVDLARAVGRRNAALLLPPVDVGANAPGAVDGAGFRTHYAIPEDGFTIVSVSRLTSDMEKDDTLDRLIGAVEILGHSLPLRLVIVGDGDARSKLERRAAAANSRLGRLAVTLTGEILDPRPAYQAADIVAGMGGSTLRGMAFGKPTIVMGSKGFAEILGPDTASRFYYKGLYGIGNEDTGSENLVRVLRDLFRRPDSLLELGAFARSFVVRHFSLEAVAACLETYCRDAAEKRPSYGNLVVDALRTSAVCSAHIVRQRINGLPI